MKKEFLTSQARCKCGAAKRDITPPIGIYHRMWGAATHETATGVHKPLKAYGLYLERKEGGKENALLVISLDHCIIDCEQMEEMRIEAGKGAGIQPNQVIITLTHTHGSGWMSLSRSNFPGGELIEPYFKKLLQVVNELGQESSQTARAAILVVGKGACNLARNRDYYDADKGNTVCGFNPDGYSDDTLMVAKITSQDNKPVAVLVNYACHPTTLAWENTKISPDFVGALRDTVEEVAECPCVFFQGASGDLGPLDGFTGDCAVAEKNGKQIGYAAASILASLPPPGTKFVYQGQVVSGATLGIWNHQPLAPDEMKRLDCWKCNSFKVALPYKNDMPTIESTLNEQEEWAIKEKEFLFLNKKTEARDCHAMVERMTRQLTRLQALPQGKTYPFEILLFQTGEICWVFTQGELYQKFQTELRSAISEPMFVVTQANDWQPGYLPAESAYEKGIYQEEISPMAKGALEKLICEVRVKLEKMVSVQVG